MAFYWLKTFHIVGVVVWFAGLFYLARLYVYHQEAEQKSETEREVLQAQFSIMESRLLNIITTPGMVITLITAISMLYLRPFYLKFGWMHAKLTFVILLVIYHIVCMRLLKPIQERTCTWTPQQFRAFNEVPTLLLISVVMLVVFQTNFPTQASVWLMVGLVIFMVVAIQMYAKKRKRDEALSQTLKSTDS